MDNKVDTSSHRYKPARNLLIHVDNELKARLKVLAEKSEMSLDMYVREVLRDAIKANPRFELVAHKVNN